MKNNKIKLKGYECPDTDKLKKDISAMQKTITGFKSVLGNMALLNFRTSTGLYKGSTIYKNGVEMLIHSIEYNSNNDSFVVRACKVKKDGTPYQRWERLHSFDSITLKKPTNE